MPPSPKDAKGIDLKDKLVTSPFSCVQEADKHRCLEGGGQCKISADGYYIVNVLCIIIGVITFWAYIRSAALKLQSLPLRAWRTSGST